MTEKLTPKDRAEMVALFKAQVISPLTLIELGHGELAAELRKLSRKKLKPPWAPRNRTYAASTLERWYYDYKRLGLDGLKPRPRSDRGYAQALTAEQRDLILGIAHERPDVNVSVLLRTLVTDGRLGAEEVSEPTVRRLLAAHGLSRGERRTLVKGRRRRWEAPLPDSVWHADVCHGPALEIGKRSVPLRIHAILDDRSRFVVAMRAYSTEREVDMLHLMVDALRRGGPPDTLYLDNGSTYRGEALQVACGRLGIRIVHAEPYSPEGRGKMERFWRTLRGSCLDHLGTMGSLHDVQVRLLAFLNHYHAAPHAGLVGRVPIEVYATDRVPRPELDEVEIRDALTVRTTRKVRRDGTVPVGGVDWEVDQGFLAGRKVTIARSLFAPDEAPWIEHDERRYDLARLDPVANGLQRRKSKGSKRGVDAIPFDPAGALLDKMTGKSTSRDPGEES